MDSARLEVDIQALAADGTGIGRADPGGPVVFVPATIPGERVQVRVVKRTRRYWQARLERLLRASPDRVTPPCPVFGRCGGCRLMHVRSSRQLDHKLGVLADALRSVGGVELPDTTRLHRAPAATGYRNRGHYPVRRRGGRVASGFFAPGSHQLVAVERCLLHHPAVDRAVGCVQAWANRKRVPAYDEARHQGWLRHVSARVGDPSGEVLVTLVVRQPRRLPYHDLLRRLRRNLPGLVGLQLNFNPGRGNAIFGRTFELLWGRDRVREKLDGLKLHLQAHTFFQVNSAQARVLFGRVVDFLAGGRGPVIDAYCGAGALSLLLARELGEVLGVDNEPSAIAAARRAAAENAVADAEFLCGRAERELPRLVAQGRRPRAVVVDPPRRGCQPEVLEAIIASPAERLAYISCHPGTLARDLRLLLGRGFRLTRLEVVDMFPHTAHLEVLAGLER